MDRGSKFLDRLQALEDAYYAVSPSRRAALVPKVRAAIGRHLEPDHLVLKDFDAAQHMFGPRSLENIARNVHGIRYFYPWEWITHLCRSVDICEFMLSYWLVCQRWMPQRALSFALVRLMLGCVQWRKDAADNEAVERARIVLPACLIPFAVAHAGEQAIAVNVNQRGWGWARAEWWRSKEAPSILPPPAPIDLLPYAMAALVVLSLLFPEPVTAGVSVAALSANTVWEVRTAGAATNGGGFVTGAAGTDWSQQNAAQYSVTDGVTAGTTTITSATANFGTDVVGNIMYVAGGTGAVAADWYQITARASSLSITVDRSTGLTAGTGVTLIIGGALSDPAIFAGKLVTGNTVHQKSGTYSLTSATQNVAGGCPSFALANGRWIGYQTTRGDYGTKPLMQASGISTATLFDITNAAFVSNIKVDGASLTAIRGVASGSTSTLYRVEAVNCTNSGIISSGSNKSWASCFASGCTTAGGALNANSVVTNMHGCVAADNTVAGFGNAQAFSLFCLADSNAGASTDGWSTIFFGLNCVSYGSGRDGMRTATSLTLINCIVESNTGYGVNNSGAAVNNTLINCAGYNNTSGFHNAIPTLGQINLIAGSASFFVDAPNGNFALNTTAGGGALARAAGIPGVFPGGLTTGYLDVGAAQHQDSGGGLLRHPGMAGGLNA